MTEAHDQIISNRYKIFYPEHEPREKDPHYKLFKKARKRIINAGVGCWICGSTENRELHHSLVEFASANGVDYKKLSKDFPQYHLKSEEDFLNWVESESNLQVLCSYHHRSPYAGIHHVDYPNWILQKYWKDDLPQVTNPV